MNRHQRCAAEAQSRRTPVKNKTAAIMKSMDYLTRVAAATATGITIFYPDSTSSYVDADGARVFCGNGKPQGELKQKDGELEKVPTARRRRTAGPSMSKARLLNSRSRSGR